MAYIDSSTARSPLSGLSAFNDDDEMDEVPETSDIDQDEPEEEVAEQRRPGIYKRLVAQIDDINIARTVSQTVLDQIGMTVVEEFRIDEDSRQEWHEAAEAAMKLALQKTERKTSPWPGASNVVYPLIGQAAFQFGATAYPTIVSSKGVVKGSIWGDDNGTPVMVAGPDGKQQPEMQQAQPGPDGQAQPPQPVWLIQPGEKQIRANKIGQHMSYQLLTEMPEWEPQLDTMLHQIPVVGGAIRKTYRDPVAGCNKSLFVSIMNLVWNYNAPSFEAAPRHSEKILLYPHEIAEYERTGQDAEGEGMFLPITYAQGGTGETGYNFKEPGELAASTNNDPDAPELFIEQHRRWDLDDDGYSEPYIITVHLASAKVVRIVARYDKDGIEMTDGRRRQVRRITPDDLYTLFPFLPSLDGSSYPMGFGHYLKGLNESINTTLNQMFDAGTLANAGGGFVADGIGIPSGQVNFQVGKYIRVTTKGQGIRDSILPLPFQGPNAVLMQLLGLLMEAAKEAAAIQSILAGDSSIANAPPTTVLALIEQGLKFYTAITKRVFRALKEELQKLYKLNRKHIRSNQRYKVGDAWAQITPDDYRLGGGVEPVADPTMITDMQKLGRAQILMSYKGDPTVKQDQIALKLFEAAGFDRPGDLLAPPNPMLEQAAQVEMAQKVAELGRTRAAEQKDATQAYLNLANARNVSDEATRHWIDSQMEIMRIHVESLNATLRAREIDLKAEDLDHRRHDTHLRTASADADRLAAPRNPGQRRPRTVLRTREDPGEFAVGGPVGAGVQPMAPPPGNQGLPAIPPGPGGQLAAGG